MENSNAEKKAVEKHIFSSDRPIQSSSEDQLNRAKFASELALSISNWTEKDSLVLAVYGQWGDGKSSVKNMVREVLGNVKLEKAPIVMEFNPWQWANEELLTEAFFKELSTKLGSTEDKEQIEIAKKLLAYAEYLELNNELIGKFKSIAEKVLLVAAGSSGVLSGIAGQRFQFWLLFFAFVLTLASLLMDELIWGTKFLARWRNLKFGKSKTLEDRKQELIEALGNMSKTLVVVIDDIDRLSKSEIKSLFRIIKANADFPNIVYLTFFQRDIVEKSLENGEVYEGSEYLKKIIQVGFDLPKVPSADIHNIFFGELNKLLADSALSKKFDKARWSELFSNGLGEYFKNLRDVNMTFPL